MVRRGILVIFFTSLLPITSCNGFATNKDIKPYGLNLRCKIKPERRDDFISVIKDRQRETLELEPASLQYVVGEDVNDCNTFYIHQQYLGEEGFVDHVNLKVGRSGMSLRKQIHLQRVVNLQ